MVSLKKKRQRHETDERESFTRPASVGNLHSPPRFDSILAVALADQFPTLDEIDLSVTRSVLSPARNNSFVFELKRHDERPLGPPPLGLPFRSPISWWSSDVGHHRTSRSLNPTIFHWFAIAFGGAARAKKKSNERAEDCARAPNVTETDRCGNSAADECTRGTQHVWRIASSVSFFFFLQVVYRPLFRFRWGSLRC